MQHIFKAIELWASESDDRAKLLIIFVWIAIGIFVLLSIATTAWIMIPHFFRLF
jgi:nitrate reductase NapE component